MSAAGLSPAGGIITGEHVVDARVLARRLYYLLRENRDAGGPVTADDATLTRACHQFMASVCPQMWADTDINPTGPARPGVKE